MADIEHESAFDKLLYYRCYETWYAPAVNAFGEYEGESTVKLHYDAYKVIKETPKGVFILLHCGDKKFINSDWNKRYAAPDMESAYEDFKCRKERQISILSGQLSRAKAALEMRFDGTSEPFIWNVLEDSPNE